MTYEHGKSYRLIVPKKPSNNNGNHVSLAEKAEGRSLTEGNSSQQNKRRTQCRESLQSALGRIRQPAARDKKLQFTSLWPHIYNIDHLREEYYNIKRRVSPGVDEQTYEESIENRYTGPPCPWPGV